MSRIDIRHQTKKLGKKAKKEEMCAEDQNHQKDERVQEGVHEDRLQTQFLRMGVVPGRVYGSKAPGLAPTQREMLRRQLASAAGKKPSISLSLFLKINNLETDHELACKAT